MRRAESSRPFRPSIARRPVRRSGLGALLVLAAFHAPGLNAQAACDDVSGAWTVDLVLPDGGAQQVTLTLEQTECELTGLIEGQNKTPIEGGKVDGSTFTFMVTANNQADGQGIEIAWEGTVEADAISGTWSAAMIGTLEFTGTRADG